MKNVLRALLFPVMLWLSVFYSCYEIFYAYVVEGGDPWIENPIQSAGSLFGFPPRLAQKR